MTSSALHSDKPAYVKTTPRPAPLARRAVAASLARPRAYAAATPAGGTPRRIAYAAWDAQARRLRAQAFTGTLRAAAAWLRRAPPD